MSAGSQDVFDSIVQRLRAEFLADAQERLTEIESVIGANYHGDMPADEAMLKIRRHAHNLKGMGASFQFPIISLIAHRLEDYVASLRAIEERHFTDVGRFVDTVKGLLESDGEKLQPSESEQNKILRSLPAKWLDEVVGAPINDVEILLVAQSKVSSRVVERELVACGYRVVATFSPIEAFELVVRMKPDMVVTSMVMNDLSGVDLARAFAAMDATKAIPVGVLTSLAANDARLQNLPANCVVIRSGANFQDDLADAVTKFGVG